MSERSDNQATLEAAARVQAAKSHAASQEVRRLEAELEKLREKQKTLEDKIEGVCDQRKESRKSTAGENTLQADLLQSKRAYESHLRETEEKLRQQVANFAATIDETTERLEAARASFAQEQAKATAYERHRLRNEEAIKKSYLAAESEEMQEDLLASAQARKERIK